MKKILWIILSFLSFALCGYIYVDSHSAEINIAKANYNFKKNNLESAIKYYEQAFMAGNKDSKARYNYVNLVINSPLDANAQERLVKFLEIPEDDAARFKANSFLNELRYQIHKKYPDNYISQGTYNQKILRWSSNIVTYGYTDADKAPKYYIREIDEAFSAWEKALDGKVRFQKTDNHPNIIIQFNETPVSAEENEKYVVALTKPVLNLEILKNIVTDYYLAGPDGNLFSENQVYNTALHEIGHTLGFMGHSDNYKNVMHMSTDTRTVTNDLRKRLTDSDINTMKLLYSIKPDITDSKSPKGEYTKFLVLGDNVEVSNAKIREAKTYISKAPNLPSGYIDLADAYVTIKEYSKAEKCLHRALMLARDNETLHMIYYNLALTSYFNENYEDAKTYLEKSGPIKNSETAIYLMAEIYKASGAQAEAIGLYEDLISNYPDNIEYVIALANIYVRNNSYLKARAVLKDFISKNPEERNNPRLAPYGIIKIML